MARKSQKDMDNDVLSRIDRRASDWFEYYDYNNTNYHNMLKFIYYDDGQWSDDASPSINFDTDSDRPRFTFNMIPRLITNLAAEFSENVPDLEVRSEHFTEVDQHETDILTNLLRKISLDSRNKIIYQNAAQCAWAAGYGAFRIIVERERVGSFDFVIRYKDIHDPTTCFWDPMSRLADKSDGTFCGIALPMNKKEFKSKYPNITMPTPLVNENRYFSWISEEQITIVDYWERVPVKKSFSLLSDNTVVPTEQADEMLKQKNKQVQLHKERFPADPIQRITVVKTEEQEDFKIMFYRAIKDKILESSEWDGKKLPVIFVAGIRKWIEGKERVYGIVHWMRDAQITYNWSRNEYLYRLQLERYEKIFATKENVANNEAMYQNIYKAQGALLYKLGPNGEKPYTITKQSIGPDLQLEMQRSFNDLQAIPGRFDPNMGAQGSEISGTAIANRQRGGNLNVKEFFDNVVNAIESGARVVVDLIPKVYDTTRRVTIEQRGGEQEQLTINQGDQHKIPSPDVFFDVKVTVGSSFAIQQSENVSKLISLTQANPELHKVADDLIAENLDLQNGTELVTRIKRYVMPEIIAQQGTTDEIVKKNAEQMQQNPKAQLAQQATQLQLQALQLDNQKKQQDMMLSQMKSQDDRIKALSAQGNASANLMNAQTNQSEAQVKGVVESQKIQAEQERTKAQVQTEILKLETELAKADQAMPQQVPQIAPQTQI